MAEERRNTVSLLSLIASKAIIPGMPVTEKSDSQLAVEEEQQTQTMMYAARMKYLDDSDPIKPDPLFLTRKQAQKIAQRQDSLTMSFKKLEMGGSQGRKVNATNVASAVTTLNRRKSKLSTNETSQLWEPKFQAGCHFWQNVETGECRVDLPPSEGKMFNPSENAVEEEDDPPFPDCFAFLNTPSKYRANAQ